METIRVTVVAEALWHRVPGGTGVATQELLRGLQRHADIELDAVCASRSHEAIGQSPVEVRRTRLPRVALYEAWARSGRPDISSRGTQVIHSPMLMAPTSSKQPVVVTVHDLAWLHRPEDFPRRARELYRRMWKRVSSDAAHIVCSSKTTADQAVSAGADPERVSVVYLGGRNLHSWTGSVSEAFGVRKPFILSVGTAEPRKNLGRLLAAFEASELWRDGVQLAIVGPDGWRYELAASLDALHLDARAQVVAVGRVRDGELGALYREAIAFAYPSLLEGFGLPVLEALSAGTPVLTSSSTATAEIAGDAGVLVDPTSVVEITEGLKRIVTDDQLRTSLVAAAPRQAERFSWSRHLGETVSIYQGVAQ